MKGLVAALTVALGIAVLAAPQKVERKAVFCGGSGDWELSKCCALSGKENPKLLLFCTANEGKHVPHAILIAARESPPGHSLQVVVVPCDRSTWRCIRTTRAISAWQRSC